jgi:integrase
MAIIKRSNTFQVKLRGVDGKWISRGFSNRNDAVVYETQLKQQNQSGNYITNSARQVTLNDYFTKWFETVEHRATPGWRRTQFQQYRDYVAPILGQRKLQSITPPMVAKVLNDLQKIGKSEQLQMHVFGLLRKMFGDAIELFQLLAFNPALRSLKPKIPVKEAKHLNVAQVRTLLKYVEDKPLGLGIWIQLYLGLRMGELQALTWSDLDLDAGVAHIRRTFSRKDSWVTGEKVIREYPKGRKQHTKAIPSELLGLLQSAKEGAKSEFVAEAPDGGMLSYEWYFRTLKSYCEELEIPVIGTHGLRHSTSGVYLIHGATKDDLRTLFAHSSMSVTERYTHGEGSNLKKVSNVIKLF